MVALIDSITEKTLPHFLGAFFALFIVIVTLLCIRLEAAIKVAKQTGRRVSNFPFGYRPEPIRRLDRQLTITGIAAVFVCGAYYGLAHCLLS